MYIKEIIREGGLTLGANDLSKKDMPGINESLELYKKTILDDINLTLRVIVKDKTYVTKLVDWLAEKFIFAAPLDKLDWVLFERDKTVTISFVTKPAIYTARVQILNHYRKNGVLYYSGALVSPLMKQQQREYFRLDVLIEVHYKFLPKDAAAYDIDELPLVKATSVNISMGGLCLVSPIQLHKGDRVMMSFNFGNTPLEVLGEVLFQGEKNVSGTYSHRVKFINLDKVTQNLINKLIFEKQRLLMSKS